MKKFLILIRLFNACAIILAAPIVAFAKDRYYATNSELSFEDLMLGGYGTFVMVILALIGAYYLISSFGVNSKVSSNRMFGIIFLLASLFIFGYRLTKMQERVMRFGENLSDSLIVADVNNSPTVMPTPLTLI
jgi:hypothetical protein